MSSAFTSTGSGSRVSARKRRANRRNARQSTGPRTVEGKTRAARNALRHGVFCSELLLPGESKAMFAIHRDGFVRSLQPQDSMELFLVERIVTASWKLRRLDLLERTRYQQEVGHMRQRAEETLEDLEQDLARQHEAKQRRQRFGHFLNDEHDKPNRGQADGQEAEGVRGLLERVESQTVPPEWIQARMSSGDQGLEEIERMSRLEQRLENSVHRNMRELERLRKARRQSEQGQAKPLLLSSPYAADLEDLLEQAEQEAAAGHGADENVRNEATEEGDDANDAAAEELATDGAGMNTDKNDKEATKPDVTGCRPARGGGFDVT